MTLFLQRWELLLLVPANALQLLHKDGAPGSGSPAPTLLSCPPLCPAPGLSGSLWAWQQGGVVGQWWHPPTVGPENKVPSMLGEDTPAHHWRKQPFQRG